jgi:hypothetical protein
MENQTDNNKNLLERKVTKLEDMMRWPTNKVVELAQKANVSRAGLSATLINLGAMAYSIPKFLEKGNFGYLMLGAVMGAGNTLAFYHLQKEQLKGTRDFFVDNFPTFFNYFGISMAISGTTGLLANVLYGNSVENFIEPTSAFLQGLAFYLQGAKPLPVRVTDKAKKEDERDNYWQ